MVRFRSVILGKAQKEIFHLINKKGKKGVTFQYIKKMTNYRNDLISYVLRSLVNKGLVIENGNKYISRNIQVLGYRQVNKKMFKVYVKW